MADFQLDDLPTYMIWRSEPLDDSFDLTTGLNFFPTKGSAELDEALQFWFLLSQTPQVRRRDAVIAFLNEEKDNSSSEASGPLSSTELDNGTQTSTSASTGFHSYDTGPHQSPPTDIIYGPIDECVNHHLPPPAPLEGNVEAHFMNMVRIIRRISARIYGTPSEALPLLESPDYHTSMGAPPSGSTERTDCSTSLDPTNRVTRARFVQNGYQCEHGDCLKTFNRACDLRHHTRKHIAPHERPFVCLDCGKRFLWQKDLSRHHGQVHTRLGKHPHARSPRRSHVCSDCSARFSRLSDMVRHHKCVHNRCPVRVDDDVSNLPRRNDPSHPQGSMAIASRDRPFPYGHSGKPLLWEKHMSQALRQTTKTSLRRLDSTPDMHGSIPKLSVESRHEPFRIRGLLLVVLSSPGLWMVESVALLLCLVFGVTYLGFVDQLLKLYCFLCTENSPRRNRRVNGPNGLHSITFFHDAARDGATFASHHERKHMQRGPTTAIARPSIPSPPITHAKQACVHLDPALGHMAGMMDASTSHKAYRHERAESICISPKRITTAGR